MSIPVKDFDKDVANFFKTPCGFTYDSKTKGPSNALYLNPAYEKGVFTLHGHYDMKQKTHAVKSSVGLSDNDMLTTKVIVDGGNKKVEANNKTNLRKLSEYSGDVLHQLNHKEYCFFVKSAYSNKAKTSADLQLSFQPHKNWMLGAQVVYNSIKSCPDMYKIAAKFACCPAGQFALSYDSKGVATASAVMNVKNITQGRNIASYLRCTFARSSGVGLNLGFQHLCPQSGVRTRFMVDHKGAYGVSFLQKFGEVSVHVGVSAKMCKTQCPVGLGSAFVQVTRE